jgi:hypothetical protein
VNSESSMSGNGAGFGLTLMPQALC